MPTREITITDDVGLHARPAAKFVKTATGFRSSITVHRDERVADAKSLLQVLQLEAGRGAVVRIEAEGDDADLALDALADLLAASTPA